MIYLTHMISFKIPFHCCIQRDGMDKTRYHLHISPPYPLPGASSPPTDVATQLRRVMLIFHGAKTSSLPPLHLPATLHLVVSPLELKLKH
jgi:hypothetical protein